MEPGSGELACHTKPGTAADPEDIVEEARRLLSAGPFRAQNPRDRRRNSGASGPCAIHEPIGRSARWGMLWQSRQHEGSQGHPGDGPRLSSRRGMWP